MVAGSQAFDFVPDVCWVQVSHKDGDRPPKSIKAKTNYIPEKDGKGVGKRKVVLQTLTSQIICCKTGHYISFCYKLLKEILITAQSSCFYERDKVSSGKTRPCRKQEL